MKDTVEVPSSILFTTFTYGISWIKFRTIKLILLLFFFIKLPHVYFRAFGRNSINLQLVILAVKWKKRSRLHRVSPPTINVNSKPVFMSPVLACRRRRRRQFHWTWHISRTHIKPRNIFFNLTPCSVNRVQKYPLITHELRCVVAWCFAIVLHH